MRRKLALFLTCTALLLPLTGCGKDQPETSSGSSPYVDGTYQARFDTPQDGYTDYVRLSIQNGAITVEEFDGVNSSGALKSADSALKSEMEEAAPENLPYKLNPGTAFADPDNESRVQAAFSNLSQGKTVIMIAHRLSTVAGVDQIYVIEDGQITESGKSRELLKKGGVFSRMWQDYQTSVQWKVAKEVQ